MNRLWVIIACASSVLISVINCDCWWTGCQLNSWAQVGCQHYNRVERGRQPCTNGNRYQCCLRNTPSGSGGSGRASLSEQEVFKKTIYGEARGEPLEGQKWVAWVIKNRARLNKPYWGGSSIKNVCLHPGQFECWNGKDDIVINEPVAYSGISRWADPLFRASSNEDPTGGADHFNNPDKEGYPRWTEKCYRLRKIGNHQFYKSK